MANDNKDTDTERETETEMEVAETEFAARQLEFLFGDFVVQGIGEGREFKAAVEQARGRLLERIGTVPEARRTVLAERIKQFRWNRRAHEILCTQLMSELGFRQGAMVDSDDVHQALARLETLGAPDARKPKSDSPSQPRRDSSRPKQQRPERSAQQQGSGSWLNQQRVTRMVKESSRLQLTAKHLSDRINAIGNAERWAALMACLEQELTARGFKFNQKVAASTPQPSPKAGANATKPKVEAEAKPEREPTQPVESTAVTRRRKRRKLRKKDRKLAEATAGGAPAGVPVH